MSIRWTEAGRRRRESASASMATFSPLPQPSSINVSGSASDATTSCEQRPSSFPSARVIRYQGSRLIASKRQEPSAS